MKHPVHSFVFAAAVIAASVILYSYGQAQEYPSVKIFAYSHILTPNDILRDGPNGDRIALPENAFLIWVDKMPGARFMHPTAYILITTNDVYLIEGSWWPVLNGQRILYGKKNQPAVSSPCRIGAGGGAFVNLYIYPEELQPNDVLTEEMTGCRFPVNQDTFFAWIDMLPQAYFAHPVTYLIIQDDGAIIIADSQWWPNLNGKTILQKDAAAYSIPFPFVLE